MTYEWHNDVTKYFSTLLIKYVDCHKVSSYKFVQHNLNKQ